MKRNSKRFAQKQNQQNERSHSPFFNSAHDESKQHHSFFQTKLKTGEKGDKYEKEADQTAVKISGQSGKSAGPIVQKQDISLVQTSALNENDEKQIQKQVKEEEKPVQKAEKKDEEKPFSLSKEEEKKQVQKAETKDLNEAQPKHEEEKKEEHPPIMRQKKEGSRTVKNSDIPERIKNTKGRGQPIPERTAKQMGQAFDTDFSPVVIHTDGESDALNKEIHSLAFTSGQDIYFAEGQYNPDSSSGKALLAHELTHVIQQTGR